MFQTRRCAAAATWVCVALPGLSVAATLNVPGDFSTIQACIDSAVSGVDECVVAPGTYHETINFLGKAVTLRSSGGAEVTTIDATGIGGSVVTCASGEGPDTFLEGFTITGGTGTYVSESFPGFFGGGMLNLNSSPTVRNCTFIENTADNGGGMFNDYGSPTVTNCTFSGNTAMYFGGAMYNVDSSAMVTDSVFNGNTAILYGGGMNNTRASSPKVIRCTFSANLADRGGAMYNYNNSNPGVSNCAFSKNDAIGVGGGMFNFKFSSPTVTDSTFSANKAGYAGGGIGNFDHSNPAIFKCTFIGNTTQTGGGEILAIFKRGPVATTTAPSGNAFAYGGGGMYSDYYSNATVIDCSFTANTGDYGGGMYNGFNEPTILNCVFSVNTARYSGGGMYNYASSAQITGCTFARNTATLYGGGVCDEFISNPTVTDCILWRDIPNEVVNTNLSAPTMGFNDLQGGLPVGAVDGGGNIDLDPMFVRPPDPGPDEIWDGVDDDYGDLRLQAGSPCINRGDGDFVAQPGETDLEGHARELCGRVDMGAYEFGIGDYDCDQVVDLTDFANWSACMTGPQSGPYDPGCEAFDFDGDGDVDFGDLAGWQNDFNGP